MPARAPQSSEDIGDITTTADLQGGVRLPEIEVDNIVPIVEAAPTTDRVVIRMNTTLEDFTYGNPNKHWKLEAGKRYEVPRHIAEYLDGLDYLWH